MERLLPIVAIIFYFNLTFCQSFDIYVCDFGNDRVVKFDENGENPQVFINEEISGPQDLLFLEDQNIVLVANVSSGKITKHNIEDGSYIDDFATGIDGPSRMKIGKDNLLYVLQWENDGKVLRYQMDGTFVDEFTSTGINRAIGLDWDSKGNLYVSAFNLDTVTKYDQDGIDKGIFISGPFEGPTNIWFDENDNLYILNWLESNVKRYDSTGTFIEDFIEDVFLPEGFSFLPNGNILIGCSGTRNVKLFDKEGNFLEEIIETNLGNIAQITAVKVRQNQMVATQDYMMKSDFLKSTIGSGFVRNDVFEDIIRIEVYNLSGALVEKTGENVESICDQGKHPDGIYIARATTASGATLTQKIIVKN